MRLPEPKKLPSGNWRIQVLVDGKRVGRTFPTKEEAEYWAAGLKTKIMEENRSPWKMTVGAAVDRYIESKSSILSPSTVLGYKRTKKRMEDIIGVQLNDLTQEKIQRWVNQLAKDHSPKTVANAHGLLSAVLKEYRPSVTLRTTLPSKVKAEIQIPSEAEIRAILKGCRGTKYELPIMLAVWLGLRQSEILGLEWRDIDGDTLKIRRAIVLGEDGPTQKGTKTYSGTRPLHIPAYIRELLDRQPRSGDRIVNMTGKSIYSGFSRICEKSGVPHFRFHDLRHVNASAMLAVGVPDKYSMKRMGHATNNMLKTTYQHTIKEKEAECDQKTENYIESLMPDD
jgi:integrase